MATLFPPGLRLFDADGAPLSGAKVRVYTANTTTLASLYSDAALSSSILNPVETDVAGYPANGGNECAIYCAAGIYDVAFLDSSNNVLASWDDVSPAGESGDLERTLTGNGRIKITGSAGAVLIQVGDPSPDNTGGTLTIEGQAGSQGDTVTLDFATVNAGTTGGALQENGKDMASVVATPAATLSAATSLVIPLPNDPAGCRAWRVDVFDITRSAATIIALDVQLSFDGGSTYKSTNEYDYWFLGRDQSAGAMTQGVGTASASARIAADVGSATNKLMWVTLEILSPLSSSSSDATIIKADILGRNQEATSRAVRYSANVICQSASQGRPTHLKLIASTGNIDGKYRVAPLRGFGE